MWTGKYKQYHWLVSSEPMTGWYECVLFHHEGQQLHITAFDGGPLRINANEESDGWRQFGDVAISPPLSSTTQIPFDQFDEWYISNSTLDIPSEKDVFVNYMGFNLAHPDSLTLKDDPSWENGRYDFLYKIQKQFWEQIDYIQPETYISQGGLDIYASKDKLFIESITEFYKS